MNANEPRCYRIASIGEAMIELSAREDSDDTLSLGVAGDTLNTAIYLKRLLDNRQVENEVSFVSGIGSDSFSEKIHAFCTSESLDTSALPQTTGQLPGIYAISTDQHGERSFSYWRENSAARHFFNDAFLATLPELQRYDVIYYSGITLAIMSETTRKRWLDWLKNYMDSTSDGPKQVVFDSNYRPALWSSQQHAREWIEQSYRQCTTALVSVDDEMNLFLDKNEDAVITRLQSYQINDAVLKRGDKGPLSITTNTSITDTAPCIVVDSTAAGDSFNGAYLASLICGDTTEEALATAHTVAKKVIGHKGAIISPQDWQAR